MSRMGAEMTKDEALRMALTLLEFYYALWKGKVDAEAIAAIKEALAQPEQEPVAWDGKCVLGHCGSPAGCEDSDCCRADFTTPPQRKPLTDEQLIAAYESEQRGRYGDHIRSLRAIEAAHGIKE